ncbi:histone-lysine N-methyltransferase SETMAR-like [Octopus bimaculoides]|uniref:histone-lysine N-methyltransferase SETMAR-like n=1 Tax=Octopus bimaculoides TaxID=37653 RepID=UPI0022E47AF7|nr:histone-lysine N-methyltransferase SETMAR-like [Octopus bimaculoides]
MILQLYRLRKSGPLNSKGVGDSRSVSPATTTTHKDIDRVHHMVMDDKRLNVNQTKGVLLHQDNAPVHKSVIARAAVNDCGFGLVDHLPYSPDLAPSDYFLFPNMKKTFGWEAVSDR